MKEKYIIPMPLKVNGKRLGKKEREVVKLHNDGVIKIDYNTHISRFSKPSVMGREPRMRHRKDDLRRVNASKNYDNPVWIGIGKNCITGFW